MKKMYFHHSCCWVLPWVILDLSHIVLSSLPGFKIGEAKQHARKWLWQHVQWLGDGWLGVRKSPRSQWGKVVFMYSSIGKNRFLQGAWFVVWVFFHPLSRFCRRGRLRSSGWLGEGSSIPELDDLEMDSDPTLPSTEDVIRKTEQITKNIQELLRAAQENKHDRSEWDERFLGFFTSSATDLYKYIYVCVFFFFLNFRFLALILNLKFLLHS